MTVYMIRKLAGALFLLLATRIHAEGKPGASGDLPIAKIRESIVCCPLDTVVFNGWASIVAHGEIVLWMWDLDGNGATDTVCTSGELKFVAPFNSKSTIIILRVKDSHDNMSEPDSATFHIMNSPPMAKCGADTTIRIGTRVNFNPEVTSNCSKIVRYEWDFNDDGKPEYRSTENGNTSRVYNKIGRFYARFKVADEFGRETGGIRIISVRY